MTIDNTKFRGLYHFNSGGVGTDSSGNGNDLTITGTTNPAGKLNEALFTDIADDTVYNDSIISDLANDTVGSFSFWVNIDSLASGVAQPIVAVSNNSGATLNELTVRADARGAVDAFLILFLVNGTTKWLFKSTTLLSNLSGWVQVTLTHDGIEPFLYVNDTLETLIYLNQADKTTWMKALLTDSPNPSTRFAVGNIWQNGVVSQRGQIKVDELIISGQHFTSTEVSEYWNGGAGQEFSGVSGNSRRKTIQQRMLNV